VKSLACAIVRQRRWIASGWLAVGLLLLPFAPQAASRLEVGTSATEKSEAAHVDEILANRFVATFSTTLVLVATGIPAPDKDDGNVVLRRIMGEVEEMAGVAGVLSYLDANDRAFLGADSTFLVVGLAAGTRSMDDVVLGLRRATRPMEAELRTKYPTAELAWTGAAAFDYDVRLTSAADAAEAERRVLPLTLALLFIVFGSLVAALFPVVIGGVAVGLSLGAAALISPYWSMSILLLNIVSMVGLGIGIDYSLLMLSRFREELSSGHPAETAAVLALGSAGHTVVLAGSAVGIGFAGLLVVPATELRSIATGGLLVVGFSVLLAATLLPGLLTWLGPRVETGRLWRAKTARQPSRRWQQWGRWVAAHPVRVLIVIGIPLAALAWQARYISTDIPSGSWLPARMESTRGAVALQRMGQSGVVQTIRMIVTLPKDHAAQTEAGWSATARLSRTFEGDPRVARVMSLPLLMNLDTARAIQAAGLPTTILDSYVSRDGQFVLIELIPQEAVSAGALMRYVRELRTMDAANRSGLANTRIQVGGLPAHNADYQDAIGGSAANVILLIVACTFVALLVGFRSLLGALKAIVLNILSVAAAMGAAVLVFQQGYGAGLLGVEHPLDGLFPAVPIIVFCVVFGLSMDYEVFLLSRVAEGVRRGMSNDDALVDGLSRTAGVITSAALVMIVVFAGFSLGDFLIIKILGFSLAVAVLIDATLVRLAIGPALLQLGGRWNWWPGMR
jgi:RND superfamily putative drug exporter